MKRSEKEYIDMFKEQRADIEKELYSGEKIKQCLDKESFGGKYYNPVWVVTDKGRIYSLAHKKWLKPSLVNVGKKRKDGSYPEKRYKVSNSAGKVLYVHGLIANYFCDKTAVRKYGEKMVEVHHKHAFDVKKSCEENNCADNLYYTEKGLHRKLLNLIQSGKFKKKEDVDNQIWLMINSFPHNPGSTVHIVTQPDGSPQLIIKLKLKGTDAETGRGIETAGKSIK